MWSRVVSSSARTHGEREGRDGGKDEADTGRTLVIADLCDAQKVRGYPSLFLYADGKKLEEYREYQPSFDGLVALRPQLTNTLPPHLARIRRRPILRRPHVLHHSKGERLPQGKGDVVALRYEALASSYAGEAVAASQSNHVINRHATLNGYPQHLLLTPPRLPHTLRTDTPLLSLQVRQQRLRQYLCQSFHLLPIIHCFRPLLPILPAAFGLGLFALGRGEALVRCDEFGAK